MLNFQERLGVIFKLMVLKFYLILKFLESLGVLFKLMLLASF